MKSKKVYPSYRNYSQAATRASLEKGLNEQYNNSAYALYILVYFFAFLCKTMPQNDKIWGFTQNVKPDVWVSTVFSFWMQLTILTYKANWMYFWREFFPQDVWELYQDRHNARAKLSNCSFCNTLVAVTVAVCLLSCFLDRCIDRLIDRLHNM